MKKSLMFFAAAMLAGCSGGPSRQAPAQKIGMPNPASVYCVQQGGKVEIDAAPDGEIGYCQLPQGERIEEWTLFRQKPQ